MKGSGKSYIKVIFRSITASIGRFAAIFAITTLGIAFMSGLLATTSDMKITMGRYLNQLNTMDIFVKSTVGFNENELAAIKQIKGVNEAEAGWTMDAIVETAEAESYVTRIYSINISSEQSGKGINRLELVSGRLPVLPNECVVQSSGGELAGMSEGKKLRITDETFSYTNTYGNFESLDEVFSERDFTVTGTVRSPLHISWDREPSRIGNGRLGMVIFIPQEGFALQYATDIYVTVEGAKEAPAFTSQQSRLVEPLVYEIENLGRDLSVERAEEMLPIIKEKAFLKLQKAEDDFLAGKKRSEAELDEGRAKLAQGRKELDDAAAEIEKNAAAITDGRTKLADSKRQMDEVADQVESARRGAASRLSAYARDGIARYDEGRRAYDEGMAEISSGEAKLQSARNDLAEGNAKYAESLAKFEKGEADARAALDKAAQQIEEGKAQIEALNVDLVRWYVLTRDSNQGFAIYKNNAEKIDAVARVFPIFFLLIAILVVLSTMTRMVEEDRLQIGTLKALGYKKRVIMLQYLVYCMLTGILGSCLGMAIGFQAFPRIIYLAFSTQGYLPPFVAGFHLNFALISCGLVLTSTIGSALNAAHRSLHEKPASLLLPAAPKGGKRILLEFVPFLWKRMSFSSKVTTRNLIRHKKHFFMTIIGIAGCTALVTAGFGLRDSIISIARTQFDTILKYDIQISTQDSADIDAINKILPPNSKILEVFSGDVSLESKNIEKNTIIRHNSGVICAQSGRLGDFITLKERGSLDDTAFSDNSVLMSENAADALKIKAGDTFIIENADGKRGEFILDGIVENYVLLSVYIGLDAWNKAFTDHIEPNSMLVILENNSKIDNDALYAALLSNNGVTNAQFKSDRQQSFEKLLSSISLVVIFLIIVAGALAIIVLYNLTYINISERSREIATLRVLGFHRDEAAAYIFREIGVLSLFGAVLGLLLGIPLHKFIIHVAGNPDLMFGKTISISSFIFSFIITLVFSVLVDIILLKKIITIKMSESLKSVE
ncbi:MAG: hypothetical protein Ta2G_11550 [Termitinemataceae bacterium]|nr:MAG: hypothetical protein Ta2G_11550 [Termitinemataceae bacterium]